MRIKKRVVFLLGLLLFTLLLYACGKETTKSISLSYYVDDVAAAPLSLIAENGNCNLAVLPTKEGYDFAGLYSEKNGQGTQVITASGNNAVEITKSMTLFAHWIPKTYSILFDAGEGNLTEAGALREYAYGATLSVFPSAEKEGYTLRGWRDKDGIFYSKGTTVTLDKLLFTKDAYAFENNKITLYAEYEPKKISITFDFSDPGLVNETKVFSYGDTVTKDMMPTHDTGTKEIVGWASSYNGTAVLGQIKLTEDTTLFAIWQDYRLLTLVGGDGVTPVKVKIHRNETVDLASLGEALVKPGFAVSAFYTNAILSGNPIEHIQFSSGESTLYAEWKKTSYTVTFDAVSAGKAFDPISYEYGDSFALPELSKTGYRFDGWCTQSNGSDTPIRQWPTDFYGNKTLYAKFTPNSYTVTLKNEYGAHQNETVSVRYDASFTLPIPTYAGLSFIGWYDSQSGGNCIAKADGQSSKPYLYANNITVYARFAVEQFTVSFETNGGSAVSPIKVDYNGTFRLPKDPVKSGEFFNGWYFDAELTKPCAEGTRITADTTLYAKYIQSTPIATFEELIGIGNNPTANYHLTADIDLKGSEWTPIPTFQGILDGKGHSISNFTITGTTAATGFINVNEGTLQNLTLKGFTFSVSVSQTEFNAGVLAAINRGTIQNCHVKDGLASVYYDYNESNTKHRYAYFGGLVGSNETQISNCSADIVIGGTVYGRGGKYSDDYAYIELLMGGIVGNNQGTVSLSLVKSALSIQIKASRTGYGYVDGMGLLGGAVALNRGKIYDIFAETDISLTSSNLSHHSYSVAALGGFCSVNDGTIERCSVQGSITDSVGGFTTVRSGGFVYSNANTITNCYADVTQKIASVGNNNSRPGGFVGQNSRNISNCYATGSITSATTADVASFVGINDAGGAINRCFSSVSLSLSSADAQSGYFVGQSVGGSIYKCYYDTAAGVLVNNAPTIPKNTDGEGEALATLCTEAMLFDTLAWSRDIWQLKSNALPMIK